jgi:adenosylmethionine-8-amino-7-oxononanoate aminotransferase
MTHYRHPQGHTFYRRMDHPRPMIAHGEGVYLFDSDGRRYLDASGGPVLVNIGHGVDEVIEAVAEQARQAAYVHATMFTSQAVEDYSEALAGVTPLPDPCFFYLQRATGLAFAVPAHDARHATHPTTLLLSLPVWPGASVV